jgi:hypothetical protein
MFTVPSIRCSGLLEPMIQESKSREQRLLMAKIPEPKGRIRFQPMHPSLNLELLQPRKKRYGRLKRSAPWISRTERQR